MWATTYARRESCSDAWLRTRATPDQGANNALREAERSFTTERGSQMLWTIAVILLILWLLGVVGVYTIGNFIHILLVIAIIVVLYRVITGRRPVA
jgi:hypothetical protein